MKPIKKTLVSMVAMATSTVVALAQPALPQLPMDAAVRYGKLENGLTYYIRHNEEPRERVNFYIAQKVGSVQEEEDQRGLAHFLEHMCFNGTTHFPGNKIVTYCESIGVKFGRNLNAYTSTDETVYNIDDVPVVDSNIDSCLLILRDWSDGLLLEPAEIDKERGVIHEEWRMRTSGMMRILNRNLEAIYPNSRYGKRMPIGLMSVVDNFAPETLRAYYEKWYRPDLQGIVVVGDIDVDDVEARIKKTFGDIQMPENAAKFETFEVPDNEQAIYVVDKDKEQSQAIILIDYKMEAPSREERGSVAFLAQNFIFSVIEQAVNSRLEELSKTADCPFAASYCNFGQMLISRTKDVFEIYVLPKQGRDAEAVEVVLTEIERARRFGITGSEIYRAKQNILSSIEKQYDNRNKQRNTYYTSQYVRHFIQGNAIPDLELKFNLFKSFDQQLPVEVYSTIIPQVAANDEKNFVLVGFYPEKDGVELPTVDALKTAVSNARNANIQAYVDNVKDEPLISKLPKKGSIKKTSAAAHGYTMLTLSNGARVFYKQTDFNESEVVFSAHSFGGYTKIDKSKNVAMRLFDDTFSSTGLGNFTSTELQKKLAGKQASVSASIDDDSDRLSGHSTPKDLRTLFELVYLRFQEPANDPDGYANLMNLLRSQLENAEKVPTKSWSDSISADLYNNDPRMTSLTIADLDKTTYDEIRNIYKQRFQSAGDFDFFFTGAFNVDSLKLFAEQYIASLPGIKKREAAVASDIAFPKGDKVTRFTRAMETPQAYMWFGFVGDTKYSVKNAVAMKTLGSILSKRYLKSIREDGGMAYTVQCVANVNKGISDKYVLQVICPFTPAKCDSVLMLIDADLKNVSKDGVTEKELDDVRMFEVKNYNDNLRKNSYWHNCIENMVIYNEDVTKDLENTIKSVNSDDVKNVLNNIILKQHNCRTVIMLPEDMTENE